MSDASNIPFWLGYSLTFWNSLSSLLLVVAVLAGAVAAIASGLSSYISSQVADVVQRNSGERIAASERATAEAVERAKSLEVSVGEAQAEAARANAKAAETEAASKSLGIESEKERKERIKLEMHLTNRRITTQQKATLIGLLKWNRGTVILQSMHEAEAGLFASDFLEAFKDSGWHVAGTEFPIGETWFGLILYRSPRPEFLILSGALRQANIPFSIANKPPRDTATLLIGGKPPLF